MEIRGTGEKTWGVCGWDCKYITYPPAFLLRNSVVYRSIYLIIHLVDIYIFYPGSVFRFSLSIHEPRKKKGKDNLTFSLFSLPIHRHTLNPSSSGFTTTTPSHPPPPPPSNSAACTPTTSTNSASEIPTNGLLGTTSPSQTDIISSELSNPCREEENLARSCWRG